MPPTQRLLLFVFLLTLAPCAHLAAQPAVYPLDTGLGGYSVGYIGVKITFFQHIWPVPDQGRNRGCALFVDRFYSNCFKNFFTADQ